MSIRSLRCLLCLAIVALVAAGAASSASGHSRAHVADVSPSGQQYDPDALARFCLKQVRDEYVGSFGFLYEGKRLSGLRSVTMPVSVMPMMSGLHGVDCPAPAWEHIRVRLLFGDDHLRDVPVSDWQAAPDAAITNLDDPYVPTRGTLTFHLLRAYTPCYPPRLQAQLRRRLRREGVADPTAAFRPAYVQVRIRAHSGTHGVSFAYKREINNLDRCVRRGRASSSAATVQAPPPEARVSDDAQLAHDLECIFSATHDAVPHLEFPLVTFAGQKTLSVKAGSLVVKDGLNRPCDDGARTSAVVVYLVNRSGRYVRDSGSTALVTNSNAALIQKPITIHLWQAATSVKVPGGRKCVAALSYRVRTTAHYGSQHASATDPPPSYWRDLFGFPLGDALKQCTAAEMRRAYRARHRQPRRRG